MAYVDLNPIRAAICDTPEHSDFTSVQSRINAINAINVIDSKWEDVAINRLNSLRNGNVNY